jgi:mono/diheme cytochrome c family protein
MWKLLTVVLLLVPLAAGCRREAVDREPGMAWTDDPVEHGQYLVESVAMCIDCHSPRTETGQFDRQRWLQGGALEFEPVHHIPGWSSFAPGIAGLPDWSEEETIHLLQTGTRTDGSRPGPPMPPYTMNREDAAAVVAYLQSLPAAP